MRLEQGKTNSVEIGWMERKDLNGELLVKEAIEDVEEAEGSTS